jgi:hypothetical protein
MIPQCQYFKASRASSNEIALCMPKALQRFVAISNCLIGRAPQRNTVDRDRTARESVGGTVPTHYHRRLTNWIRSKHNHNSPKSHGQSSDHHASGTQAHPEGAAAAVTTDRAAATSGGARAAARQVRCTKGRAPRAGRSSVGAIREDRRDRGAEASGGRRGGL